MVLGNLKLRRILAYLVDYTFIVLFVSMVGQIRLLNPHYDEYYETYDEYMEFANSLTVDNATELVLSDKYVNLNYYLDSYGVTVSIVSIISYLAYFVGFQKWNNNQTLGKKIFRIRVSSLNKDNVKLWQYLIRSLIIYDLFLNILLIISIFIFGPSKYIFVKLGISLVSYVVLYVNILMILLKKDARGLHDLLAKTKVDSV